MIVLDTNVVSEPMRPNGNPAVRAWLDRQVAETLYLTATSLSELLVGIEILPEGKRMLISKRTTREEDIPDRQKLERLRNALFEQERQRRLAKLPSLMTSESVTQASRG